ncbi:MAG TPA: hypothetical protein VFU14_19005, partial [Acidimicrobiales bacterium]|nr:hypothetical protein [Acidimicrobiales bacterium]
MAFGLVAGVLSVAATPAIVQAADPPPGPVPPGDCEWFGEATYDRTQVYDRTASKAKQTDVWHMDARSTPVTGTECGAEVNATYDMTFADEDTVTCDPPDADPYSTTITYRQRIEVAGSQDTASVTQLVADGAEGDTRINLTFPVDPFLGTRTYSIDGGCRATDPTVVDCTTDASAAGNGYCVFDPAIVFGPCQSSRTASAVPFYFPPTAQAVQGTCTLGFEDVQSTATLTVSDVRTWRLRRTVCDRSVDTDDGGVGDCDEFDNGTNPLDPLDDTEDPCDARFGGADADLDGVTDA